MTPAASPLSASPLFARSPRAWRRRPALRTGVVALALGLAGVAALAIQPGGGDAEPRTEPRTEPSRDRARTAPAGSGTPRSALAAAAPAADLALVRATVDAVDLAKGQLTLGGRVLRLHPQHLRVVAASGLRLAGADALRPGMRLRFAREPAASPAAADDPARRIVLIYIEPSP